MFVELKQSVIGVLGPSYHTIRRAALRPPFGPNVLGLPGHIRNCLLIAHLRPYCLQISCINYISDGNISVTVTFEFLNLSSISIC